MRLSEVFDRIYVVNLPERRDRRRYVEQQLDSAGLLASPNLVFFPAIRPSGAEGFPSIGARGCFLSHLAVLKQAMRGPAQTVLVLEDDATFPSGFRDMQDSLAAEIEQADWDILYLGHESVPLEPQAGSGLRRFEGPVVTTVAYAIRLRAAGLLVAYLEAVLGRSPGDPEGGPMHVDGALTMFRAAHPELVTLVCVPKAVVQATFSSDISPGVLDRTPGLRTVVGWLRGVRRAVLQVGS